MFDASQFLPDYASDHERRVATLSFWDDAITAAIEALSHEKDPATCRVDILPWLAWEASADFWDDDWSDEVKRAAIAAQWDIHRYKGTRFAVERALSIIGISGEIVEWWETNPQGEPGTFEITFNVFQQIYDGFPIFSDRLRRKALGAVDRTKPLSRSYSYRILIPFEQSLGLAGATSVAVPLVINGLRDTTITLDFLLGLQAETTVAGLLTIEGEQDLTIIAKADLATAGAVFIACILTIEGGTEGFTSLLLGEDGAPLVGSDGAQLYGYN